MLPSGKFMFCVTDLIVRSEVFLRRLRDAETGDGDLVKVAHGLAGGVGMLGYQRFAHEAYRYERAMETAAPDAAEIVTVLIAVIEDSLEHMRGVVAQIRLVAPKSGSE